MRPSALGDSRWWRRGSVTIEAAFAFAGLITLLTGAVWGLVLVGKEISAIDSAGAIAREAARQPAPSAHSTQWRDILPPAGELQLTTTDTLVRVTVTVPHPGHPVEAVAVSLREPQ